MSKWTKSRDELLTELSEQLAALKMSAQSFDAGRLWEAKRIAVSIYIIVHDRGKNSQSLLSQLGVKEGIKFLSTGSLVSGNILSEQPLIVHRMSLSGSEFLPLCTTGAPMDNRQLAFSRWWEEDILKVDDGRTLSRKNLVCSLRDQDGGAHVDPKLTDPAYIAFARENGTGMYFAAGNNPPEPVGPGAHKATVRQIAFELETTLDGHPLLTA